MRFFFQSWLLGIESPKDLSPNHMIGLSHLEISPSSIKMESTVLQIVENENKKDFPRFSISSVFIPPNRC